MSGSHRIEVSPNNRAMCKNTECKREGIKIPKGQLRYGTFVTGPEWQSWAWKHWGCVTPKQISNLKDSVEGDPNQLDGYEELPEDLQVKIVNALRQGHIDDEDWGWDIEMNREGKNGYFTTETKRRMKAEAQLKALEEGATGEGSAVPSKDDNKKRGHVKDDPDDEPPAKKTKARTKDPKIKHEDANDGSGDEGSTTKKSKPRIKKEPKIKDEDAKTRSENEGPVNKKTKSTAKKGKKANAEVVDEDLEQEVQPVKKGRKPAKRATAEDETALGIKYEGDNHDALPLAKGKRKQPSRRASAIKKIKSEDTDTDGFDPLSESETSPGNVELRTSELEHEASEEAPKLKEGRKKGPKKATNGLAKKAKK